jgi:hypothetical protein
MAAKTETLAPSKLSPSERLARKRAAARTRQQRCRARKRQTMLEDRRQKSDLRQTQMSQDSRSHTIQDPSHGRPPFSPSRSPERDAWSDNSTQNEPIYSCVSFESQRSYEEAQRSVERSPQSVTAHPYTRAKGTQAPVLTLSSRKRKPVEIIGVPEEQPEEALVPEEEAAVAAMLSLKTGPKTPTVSPEREHRPRIIEARVAPRTAKFRYYRSWEPRRYASFEYGRPPRVPEYFKMPLPPPPPPQPHYRYYPSFQRYGRYDYE